MARALNLNTDHYRYFPGIWKPSTVFKKVYNFTVLNFTNKSEQLFSLPFSIIVCVFNISLSLSKSPLINTNIEFLLYIVMAQEISSSPACLFLTPFFKSIKVFTKAKMLVHDKLEHRKVTRCSWNITTYTNGLCTKLWLKSDTERFTIFSIKLQHVPPPKKQPLQWTNYQLSIQWTWNQHWSKWPTWFKAVCVGQFGDGI